MRPAADRPRFLRGRWAAVALVLAMAGCTPAATRSGVAYYVDRQALPSCVQSVVFVPLTNETPYPAASEGTTSALMQAIQARQVFHVALAPVDGPVCDGAPPDAGRPFDLKDLARLRQASGCQAVLVGTVNRFHPYPRMQMSLNLRLVDLRDSRILWAVDHAWDATDKTTQERMERYFEHQRGSGYEPVNWRLATVSPAVFEEFVASEVAATLPAGAAERPGPPQTP